MPINKGLIEVYDDFLAGPSTAAENRWHRSIDTADTSGPVVAQTNHLGGRWRDATAATNNNMSEGPNSGLCFQIQDGSAMVFESRLMVQTGAVASIAMNMGWNDDPTETSNTLPIELSTATFTSNSSTWSGFVYDSNATNKDWHVFWVNADVDTGEPIANLRVTSSGPTLSRWQTLQVVLNDRGSGNGANSEYNLWDEASPTVYFSKNYNTNVSRSTVLCTYISTEARAAVAHNVDIDYVYICAPRGTTA